MKKHFLLLLAMTLLPLAGWAGDITVTMGTINKFYGDTDPAITVNDFSIVVSDDAADSWNEDVPTKATLLPYLSYKRVTQGEEVNGTYYFTLIKSTTLATAHPKWNVVISGQGVVNIFQKEISALTCSTIADQTYNVGQWNAPAFTLTNSANGEVLGENDIESIVYTTSSDAVISGAGEGNKVIVKGKGNYTGTATVATFKIAAKQLNAEGIAAALADPEATFTYNNADQKPEVVVKDGETALTATTDFTVEYPADAKSANDKTITITGVGNYGGSVTVAYTIAPKDIAADFSYTSATGENTLKDYVYQGRQLKPTLKAVFDGEDKLTSGKSNDYTVTYKNNINVSTDESKATIIVTGCNNYTGTKELTFNITPQVITGNKNYVISDIADVDYTGEAHNPVLTINYTNDKSDVIPVTTDDYDLDAPNNVNAGEVTLTITGKGNYKGTATKTFNIKKVNLTVNAKDFEKSLGNADPTSDELAAGNYYELTGFVDGEDADKAGVTGVPAFAIASHTETAGTKTGVISIKDIGTLAAANYEFNVGTGADLIISKAGVAIAVAGAEETYGYKLPTLDKEAFDFTATGLLAGEEITGLTFTVKQGETTFAAEDMLEAGEYDIIASGATATSGSYEFSYTAGKLTINRKAITIKAMDQEIEYGEEPSLAKNTPEDGDEFTSWDNTIITVYDENNDVIEKSTFYGKYNVWKENFVESLTWNVDANKPVAAPGTIDITEKEGYDSKNFVVNFVNGTVTYKEGTTPTEVVLDKAEGDVLAKIQTYDGQTMDVAVKLYRKVTLANGKVYEWNQEDWNSLVLPFDVKVRELSSQIGYAIVNIYDEANEEADNAAFKLTMGTIPANTPFLLKTDANVEDGQEIKFTNKTIVAPTGSMELTAKNGISYIGTYEDVNISKVNSNGQNDPATYYKYYAGNKIRGIGASSDNEYTVYPFGAFFNWTAPAAGSRMTITVQDADGSMTSISSIDTDTEVSAANGWYNLNGVKMNGAPTQKGIYVKDGKTVIIK